MSVGDKVEICEFGHSNEGERGQILFLPDEDGPWYEVRLDGTNEVAVVLHTSGLFKLNA